jgi:hypothetical protein
VLIFVVKIRELTFLAKGVAMRTRGHPTWICIGFILLTGCGAKHGEVTGKVMHKGDILPGGTVTFWPQVAGNVPAHAKIAADGTYSAKAVPVGEVVVTVETESLSGAPKPIMHRTGKTKDGRPVPGGPPPEVMERIEAAMQQTGTRPPEERERGNYVRIDQKYARPDHSGLKTTVQSGSQEFNIDLK